MKATVQMSPLFAMKPELDIIMPCSVKYHPTIRKGTQEYIGHGDEAKITTSIPK